MEYELSYLIRMGAGKHPQEFGGGYWSATQWDITTTGEVIAVPTLDSIKASCALGAASVALATLSDKGLSSAIDAVVRAYQEKDCPNIIDWNDGQRLTREVIADRLDALPGGSPKVRVP